MMSPVHAVWVARFHYHYPDDIRTIIRNCADAGVDTVYWQVRGDGTVAYPSQIEPWSREYDFRNPGFDPLAIAVETAHAHDLRIEAWINVMPGWKGPDRPPMPGQLFNAHPDWFIHDEAGRPQPLVSKNEKTGNRESFYVILNPCLPDVRRHITAVVEEIVTLYDVDGIHLDYVRWAWDATPGAKRRFPRDPVTLKLYHRETGRHPDDDLNAWDAWRANQLTHLVADISETVQSKRPGGSLTAAVWRHPRRAYQDYLQNGVAWLRSGLVDALVPMAYTADPQAFRADIKAYHDVVGARLIIPGIGVYKHDKPETLYAQLQQCSLWGGDFALFSYASLFPTAGDRGKTPAQHQAAQQLRHTRRAVVNSFLPAYPVR